MKKDQFHLETNRLYICPLTKDQLLIYYDKPNVIAKVLELNYATIHFEKEYGKDFIDALESFCIPNIISQPDLYLWYTMWLIVDKDKNSLVGSIGFAGPPKENKVEIGYGINIDERKKGYATEAVNRLVDWVFDQNEISKVIAHTLKNESAIASQNVLLNAGFKNMGSEITDDGDVFLWQKEKIVV